jgi:hypothetical protein
LRELDAPVETLHKEQLRGIAAGHLEMLLELLEEVRGVGGGVV